jgi:inosine-uridine nucleoside N-ribohydrolase
MTPAAEFNVHVDPACRRDRLRLRNVPIVMFGLGVTHAGDRQP